MRSPIMQNITLAIRLLEISLLISQRPSPNDRQIGIPIGHPNSAVAMSNPIVLRSAVSKDLSHSRTGSLPVELR